MGWQPLEMPVHWRASAHSTTICASWVGAHLLRPFELILSWTIRGTGSGRRKPQWTTTPRLDAERGTHAAFMDSHTNVEGLTAEAVAGAHKADLETQPKHGVDHKQYWFNDAIGSVFCLVEAPDAEAAMTVHARITASQRTRSPRSTKATSADCDDVAWQCATEGLATRTRMERPQRRSIRASPCVS